MKAAVCQPLSMDLAFQKPGGLHLDVVLDALFRGPFLTLFAVAGWAASDRAELWREGQREAGLRSTRGERGGRGRSRTRWRGGRRVEMAV